MFLLYAVALAIAAAWALGGRPVLALEHRWRAGMLIWSALAAQLVLFSPVGAAAPDGAVRVLHLASYGLALLFMWRNRDVGLGLAALGTLMNLAAIVANGGVMPVSPAAFRDAFPGAPLADAGNAAVSGHHNLAALGDVMALPSWLPFANVFSIGDVLIGAGVASAVLRLSLAWRPRPSLGLRRLVAPLADRPLRRLWLATLVSRLGDWLTAATVVGWAYTRGGSGLVAAALLARTVPPAVLSPLGGLLADARDRRTVMLLGDLGRLAAAAALAVAVAMGSAWAAVALLGVSGAVAALAGPAASAYLPRIVPAGQLVQANALLGLTRQAAMVAGLAGGGALVAVVTPWAGAAVDALTFAASAALVALLPAAPPLARAARRRAEASFAALRFLARSRPLAAIVIAFSAATFATGLVNAVLADHAAHALHAGPWAYGALMAALAGGLLAGQLLTGATVDRARPVSIGPMLVGMGLAFMVLAEAGTMATAVMAMVACGLADGASDVLFQSAVQSATPDALQGRVFGVAQAGLRSGMVLSAVLVLAAPGMVAMTAIGVAALTVAAAGAVVVLACDRRREEPAPAAAPS